MNDKSKISWVPFRYVPLREHESRILHLEFGEYSEPLYCSVHHISFPAKMPFGGSGPDYYFNTHLLPYRGPEDLKNFDALSYVWGSDIKPCVLFCHRMVDAAGKQTDFVQPTSIPITASLDCILREVRKKSYMFSRYLWIDAVCINQEDLEERKRQVLRMGDIYSRAKQTLVCLGDDQNDSREAFHCITRLQDIYGALQHAQMLSEALDKVSRRPWLLKRNHPGYIMERSWQCFEKLLSSPWLSRVWVFQEAVLSRKIQLLYNKSWFSWDALSEGCQLVEDFQLAIKTTQGQPLHSPIIAIKDTNSWRLSRDPGTVATPKHPRTMSTSPNTWATNLYGFIQLDRLLLMMRNAQASDPRDKVYALLGISAGFDKDKLIPDYSIDFQQCYVNTSKVLHGMRDLSPLAFLSFTQHDSLELNADLPSWCPDWRKPLQPPWLILYSARTFLKRFPDETKFTIRRGLPLLIVRGFVLMEMVGFERSRPLEAFEQFPRDLMYPQTSETYYSVLEMCRKGVADNSTFDLPTGSFWTHHAQHKGKDMEAPLLSTVFDLNAKEPDIDIAAWDRANEVQGIMHGRRCFVTDLGFIGFAPAASTIGDEICIFHGGKVPYVIRRQAEGIRFVGECFVFGIMNGEAIRGLKRNKAEEFELY